MLIDDAMRKLGDVLAYVLPCLCLFSSPIILHAEEVKCPKTLAWKDATHLQRTSYNGNLAAKAEWKLYSNATYSMLEVDGSMSQLLQLSNGLNLTFGKQRPSPVDFASIANAVATPMWDAGVINFLHFPTPCALKSGESQPFNERDFIYWKAGDTRAQGQIFGSVKRQGLIVTYAMEVKRGKSDDQLDSLFGTWEFQAKLEVFPENADVQGWHVFRGNDYLKTVPTTNRITLRELLLQMQN